MPPTAQSILRAQQNIHNWDGRNDRGRLHFIQGVDGKLYSAVDLYRLACSYENIPGGWNWGEGNETFEAVAAVLDIITVENR